MKTSAVLQAIWGIKEGGWIHPNGEFEEIPNYRAGQHDRDAYHKAHPGVEVPSGRYFYTEYTSYLKQGHIRYIQAARGFNIELMRKPTESQMRTIRKGIKEGTGDFYFSVKSLKTGMYAEEGSSWEEFRKVYTKLP